MDKWGAAEVISAKDRRDTAEKLNERRYEKEWLSSI